MEVLGAGRKCNGCTLCCKLMRVDELQKPQGEWCHHCSIGVGCKIYDSRPADCRTWLCGYLKEPEVPAAWYPKDCHMVIDIRDGSIISEVHVDPDHLDAWREEPFHTDLRDTAQGLAERLGWVRVVAGDQHIAVLPTRDVQFDRVGADEEIQVTFTARHQGDKLEPFAYQQKKGGPRPPRDQWR